MNELFETYRANLNAECIKRGWESPKTPGQGSPSALMKILGRSNAYWSDRLSGRKPITTNLAFEIEDALDLGRLALAGGTEGEFIDVPRIDVKLSAGAGQTPHLEDVIGHLKFSRSFLRSCGVNAASARVVDVRGNSMEPTIRDGAVLLVSTNNREPTENQIYALARPVEGLMVKRLVRLDGQWLARSDNRDYPDFAIGHGEPIYIIGRAIWMGAKL